MTLVLQVNILSIVSVVYYAIHSSSGTRIRKCFMWAIRKFPWFISLQIVILRPVASKVNVSSRVLQKTELYAFPVSQGRTRTPSTITQTVNAAINVTVRQFCFNSNYSLSLSLFILFLYSLLLAIYSS